MSTVTRSRETLFAKYIFRYNPHYKGVPVYYDRHANATVEGGDILVLSDKVVAIGISQRTQPWAIEQLAKELLSQRTGFEKVLAIDIPKNRSVYASGYGVYHGRLRQIYYAPQHQRRPAPICSGAGHNGHLAITEEHGSLENILREHLHLDHVTLIKCGGGLRDRRGP